MNRIAIVTLSLIAWLAGAAQASLRPPVTVELSGHPVEALAGVEYRGTLDISAPPGDEISFITFEGQGWSGGLAEVPNSMIVPPEGVLSVLFRILPQDPRTRLRVSLFWNQEYLDFPIDLSPRAFRWATQSLGTLRIGGAQLPGPLNRGRMVDPAPAVDVEWAPELRSPAKGEGRAQINKDYSITVEGRMVYTRNDTAETVNPFTVGAFGVTVRIYDDDAIGKQLIAETTTDEEGFYSKTFTWNTCLTCESAPDIFLQFRSESASFTLKSGSSILKWETDTQDNVGAGTLNFGTLIPTDEDTHPALHILSTVTHASHFSSDNGYLATGATIKWPVDNGGTSFYTESKEELSIDPTSEWSEFTIAHEYGHHWIATHAVNTTPDYCNSTCDGGPGCGHCVWCNENNNDAYNEGWPDWFGATVARDRAADYGKTLSNIGWQFENLGNCVDSNGNACTCTAAKAEGFIASLLNDIEDSVDDDNNPLDSWQDQLSLGADEILDVAALDEPTTPRAFVSAFHARFPDKGEKLWKLATDIGFSNLDTSDPSNPTTISSTSHTLNLESADPTISFEWSGHDDDFSGVMAFSVTIASTARDPGTTVDVTVDGASTGSFTSSTLSPGAWYISIRTQDRAGNWTSGYVSEGPYLVREPLPADLTYDTPSGWDAPLVPRDDALAWITWAPVSVQLDGDQANTYWNAAIANTGDVSTGASFSSRVYVDGLQTKGTSGGIETLFLTGGATLKSINNGPLNVRGGRHLLSYVIDHDEELAETNEVDNSWGGQWIWKPITLPVGAPLSRSAPPDPEGGHSHRPTVSFIYPNCDGVRFTSLFSEYHAVVAWNDDTTENYDLHLHESSTGPTDGFGWVDASSTRPAGKIDALLVNQLAPPSAPNWDVGVVKPDGTATGGYTVHHVLAEEIPRSSPTTVTLDADERLFLGHFFVGPDELGQNTIRVEVDPAAGQVNVAWFDWSFTQGGLRDASDHALTDEEGVAIITFDAALGGTNAVAIWRDPEDDLPSKTLSALDIEIRWKRGYDDLFVQMERVDWYSPIAPTSGPIDDPEGTIDAPPFLQGDAAATFMNVALGNGGQASSATIDVAVLVDGTVRQLLLAQDIIAGEESGVFSDQPLTVPAGRHTLGVILDPGGTLQEGSEANNRMAVQYVWSGPTMAAGQSLERSAPPSPVAGWGDLPGGSRPLWYACDGLALPVESAGASYMGVAVLPQQGGDVDVRLHESQTGILDGFGASLVSSGWGRDESDFVVINTARAGQGPFAAGVIAANESGAGYRAQRLAARDWGPAPVMTPPTSFGSLNIVDLHTADLIPGVYQISLESIDGTVDWGVAVHPHDVRAFSKSAVLGDAAAWWEGPGQDESTVVTIEEAGRYCISVWRADNAESAKAAATGTYVLRVAPVGATAISDQPSSRVSGLRSIVPNPFNPSTAISFELANDGPVVLELYDLRGQLVRRLVHESMAAGTHTVRWDGRDGAGQLVASGAYLARLRSADARSSMKMTLLK